jgi:mono/diheme cytochrome c family protein
MCFINKLLLSICILFIAACSGGNSKDQQNGYEAQSNETAEVQPDKAGENLYLKYCMACHQTDGSGVPGMYPPLINSPIVNSGKKEDFIKVLLNGLKGPIEVHGKVYNQQMPSQNFLSDEELALIINYVSKSFGNKGSQVTPGDIKSLRGNSSQ